MWYYCALLLLKYNMFVLLVSHCRWKTAPSKLFVVVYGLPFFFFLISGSNIIKKHKSQSSTQGVYKRSV
jgi:hypothetical protein